MSDSQRYDPLFEQNCGKYRRFLSLVSAAFKIETIIEKYKFLD